MMIEWHNSTDTQYLPVALREIGERVIDQRERVPAAHIAEEERERRFAKIVAKWRESLTNFLPL
jgi:BioD-like phosphotransacetylase family protein